MWNVLCGSHGCHWSRDWSQRHHTEIDYLPGPSCVLGQYRSKNEVGLLPFSPVSVHWLKHIILYQHIKNKMINKFSVPNHDTSSHFCLVQKRTSNTCQLQQAVGLSIGDNQDRQFESQMKRRVMSKLITLPQHRAKWLLWSLAPISKQEIAWGTRIPQPFILESL